MKISIETKIREFLSKFSLWKTDEERKKIIAYLYIALTLFTVSFFGFFAITPTLSTISNLKKQYEDNKLVYEALNQKLSNLQLLDFQYREIQPDLELIYSAIPRTSKIPYLTRQLENIASLNGVSLTRLNSGNLEIFPNIKRDPIYSFSFTISVAGNQTSVNNFIADIINFDRIIGVERVLTGKDEEGKYTATIMGRAFFSNK